MRIQNTIFKKIYIILLLHRYNDNHINSLLEDKIILFLVNEVRQG